MAIRTWTVRTIKKKSHRPAICCDGGEPICGESFTADKNQSFEIGEGAGEQLEALIRDHHPLQPEFLKSWIALGHGLNPRKQEPAPFVGDEIEISEMGFPLQAQRSNIGKPLDQPLRCDRITIPYKNLMPAPSLHLKPRFADKRGCISVSMGREEVEYML